MKYVVMAYNNNPNYQGFTKVVKWCWEYLGWQTIIIKAEDLKLDQYDSGYLSQVVRLFASQLPSLNENDYLMTSDIDMIPLKDFNEYFKYNPEEITTFGHDLTNYDHIPICYIGMKVKKWREVFELNGITVNEAIKAYSAWYPIRWTTDQDIATEMIMRHKYTNINRGFKESGMIPKGRLDRFDWKYPDVFIDCHSVRPLTDEHNWFRVKETLKINFNQSDETFDRILNG